MKEKAIKTVHVFSKNNQVFIKNKTNIDEDQWFPIIFQWMPIVKLQEKFKV